MLITFISVIIFIYTFVNFLEDATLKDKTLLSKQKIGLDKKQHANIEYKIERGVVQESITVKIK